MPTSRISESPQGDGLVTSISIPAARTRIDVSVSKTPLDCGAIAVEDIERILASARMMPAAESDKK
jgi:hypothetical protein